MMRSFGAAAGDDDDSEGADDDAAGIWKDIQPPDINPDEDGEWDSAVVPADRVRRCSDLPWLIVFLAFTGIIHFRIVWKFQHGGRIDRLFAFDNKDGHLCDPRVADGGQTDKYLYFCTTAAGDIDLDNRICVRRCPSLANSTFFEITECGAIQPIGYPTKKYLDQVCRPVDAEGEDVQEVVVKNKAIKEWVDTAQARFMFRMMVKHIKFLSLTVIMSVALAYLWMYFLYLNGRLLVKLGIVFGAILPLSLGVWLAGLLELIPLVRDFMPAPMDNPWRPVEAAMLLVVGIGFGAVFCYMHKSIDRAIVCLEMSFICICQTKLILHPMVVVALYAIVTLDFAYAFALWRVAKGQHYFTEAMVLWCLIIGWSWTSQFVFAWSEMVVNCVTTTWCFRGGLSSGQAKLSFRDLCKAYWVPSRYHLGTCVFGGGVIGLIRPIHLTLGSVLRFAGMRYNPCGLILRVCCGELLDKWGQRIQPLNKAAFIDVATTGRPFCIAARRAQTVLDQQMEAIKILNGATFILQMVCLTVNIAVAFYMALFRVKIRESDVMHFNYESEEKGALVFFSIVIATAVSLPFLLLFDTTADAILYCFDLRIDEAKHRSLDMEAQGKLKGSARSGVACVPCSTRNLWFFSDHTRSWLFGESDMDEPME